MSLEASESDKVLAKLSYSITDTLGTRVNAIDDRLREVEKTTTGIAADAKHLATKADVAEMETSVTDKIGDAQTNLTTRIDGLRSHQLKVLIWAVGIATAALGAIVTIALPIFEAVLGN